MKGRDPGHRRSRLALAGSKHLSPSAKAVLGIRIWAYFAIVAIDAKRLALPELIERLSRSRRASPRHVDPRQLGSIVYRVLRLGSWRARCLHTSLVLFRLLLEQGDHPELVIGLPPEPTDKEAHAWVEVRGVEVGPPPGRGRHVELVRYP